MIGFLLRRLAQSGLTLLGMTALTFAIARWAPGDPLQNDPQGVVDAARRERLGLTGSVAAQYGRWLTALLTLDLGRSLVDQRPLAQKIQEALPATLMVSGCGVAVGLVASLGLGLWVAARRRTKWATLAEGAAAMVSVVPQYWLALTLMLGLATPVGVALFPLQGWEKPMHLVLPIATVAIPVTAWAMRVVSAAVGAALATDFCLAARGRGVPEWRVLLRHALPSSWASIVSTWGLAIPAMVGGSVAVERAFGIPGMGLLALDAVFQRDYPCVMATATLVGGATVLATLVADVVAALLDPRLRRGDGLA